MAIITYGNIRVQLLSEDIVRVEYANNGKFSDANTFFIPNRTGFSGDVAYALEDGVVRFGEYALYLPENATSLKGVRLEKNGKKVYTYVKLANSGELPPLDKTPEAFALSDTPRIIVPEGGYSVHRKGEYTVDDGALLQPLGPLSANEPHKIEIEYFQAEGAAFCALYTTDDHYTDSHKEVYLSAGNWLDAFSGVIYEGGQTVARDCGLRDMPLFIRTGALVPLAHEARNTKEQKWDRLVYDFYPDKRATDAGYIYEDDTETTAYKLGQLRKSAYRAGFCEKCNAYVVDLSEAEGAFAGAKRFDEREITFKVHLLGNERIERVTVNGEEVAFKLVKKDASAFPLNAGEAAPDSDTLVVTVKTRVEKEYQIKFCL